MEMPWWFWLSPGGLAVIIGTLLVWNIVAQLKQRKDNGH